MSRTTLNRRAFVPAGKERVSRNSIPVVPHLRLSPLRCEVGNATVGLVAIAYTVPVYPAGIEPVDGLDD